MRSRTSRRPLVLLVQLAAACLLLAAAPVLLAACGTQEGDGGVPTVTIQPVASGSPSSAPTQTASPSASPSGSASPSESASPAIDAAALYADNCAACHGAAGEGGVGPDLRPLSSADTAATVRQITDGGGGMPAFGGVLSEAQIAALGQHVAELQ